MPTNADWPGDDRHLGAQPDEYAEIRHHRAAKNLALRCRQDPAWSAGEIVRLRTALMQIAALRGGWMAAFGRASRQAMIARKALVNE